MAREFDSPWKEALDFYLESFLALLFPDIHAAIDWSKGYDRLDKELQEIIREAELGPTVADKLFRVHLRDGEDVWLLIHIEVQAQRDADFGRRMFTYSYRIIDRYNSDVVSLAILGDEDPAWRPEQFERERFGTGPSFRFRPTKLIDWANRLDELEHNPSPIASVVLAHVQSLLTHGQAQLRFAAKRQLLIDLHHRGLSPEDRRQLVRLIDWLLELSGELEQQLRSEMHLYEQEHKMPYITSFERLAREEGKREGLLESLAISLESRFGEQGAAFAQELQAVTDIDKLRQVQRNLMIMSKTIDELRALVN